MALSALGIALAVPCARAQFSRKNDFCYPMAVLPTARQKDAEPKSGIGVLEGIFAGEDSERFVSTARI